MFEKGSEYASFWIDFQSYGCFIFKSIWISKVTDILLGKTRKKEPAELLNGWMKMRLNKRIFFLTYHVDLHFT